MCGTDPFAHVLTAYLNGRVVSVTERNSSGGTITQTSYTYDTHGLQWQVTDLRNGTTTYGYNAADLLNTITTPAPGNGQPAQTTTAAYNSSLRVDNVTQSDVTLVNYLYFQNGLLQRTWGSRTYPVEY